MSGTSGRLILNLETLFALATLSVLLWRSSRLLWRSRSGSGEIPKPRFAIDAGDALRMASVAVLAALVFWPSTRSYFLSDDFILVSGAQNFHAGMPGSYVALFTRGGGDGFFRPLGYLSLYWTGPWAGLDPVRWHLVGLALHIANALLVYALAGAIGLSRMGAWLGFTLFALFGANPEAVVWIAGRFDLLATLFVLIALLAFIRLWEKPSVAAGMIAGVALALGILSKESAYALPLMMLVFAASRRGSSWNRRFRFVAPFFLLAAILFAYRWMLQGGIGGYVTAEGEPQMFALSLGAVAKALVLRLWAILFFPVDWAAGASAWLLAALLAALLAYAAAWIVLALKARGTSVSIFVGLGFVFVAAIPPVGQLLIGADLEKARLLYLPSVGFCFLAAAAVETSGPKLASLKLRWAASAAMLAFSLAALLHNLGIREQVAAKSKTVCEAVAACSNPESVRGLPRILEGVYFFANGLPECVRIQRSRRPELSTHSCSLRWDEKSGQLLPY